MQGWVNLVGWLCTVMVYPPKTVTHPSTNRARRRVTLTNDMRRTTLATTARCQLSAWAVVCWCRWNDKLLLVVFWMSEANTAWQCEVNWIQTLGNKRMDMLYEFNMFVPRHLTWQSLVLSSRPSSAMCDRMLCSTSVDHTGRECVWLKYSVSNWTCRLVKHCTRSQSSQMSATLAVCCSRWFVLYVYISYES